MGTPTLLARMALLALWLAWPMASRAQKPFDTWYFGDKAGLRFTPGGVTALTDGQMQAEEGCAVATDSLGNLLFYTNGRQIWNRQHAPMTAATELGGGPSATQAALVVPWPDDKTRFLLFSVDDLESGLASGARYSEVDMRLAGGLGGVNPARLAVRVPTPGSGLVTEKLTATSHANGRDVWVLLHGWNNDEFYAYRITPAGLNPSPVVSRVGAVHQDVGFPDIYNAAGYMRFDASGEKLAVTRSAGGAELFAFDRASGQVSGGVTLVAPPAFPPPLFEISHYGLEFSADGTKLYETVEERLVQYDLRSTPNAGASLTGVIVAQASAANGLGFGAIARGKDGSIYVVRATGRFGVAFLDVVGKPNEDGAACDYQAGAVGLNGRTSIVGLPNAVSFPPRKSNYPEEESALLIPNIITPNDDGLNESFALKGLQAEAWNLAVFNRWGREVYRQARYDNRWNAAGQSAGVYYYLLENPTTGGQYRGWVEVVR